MNDFDYDDAELTAEQIIEIKIAELLAYSGVELSDGEPLYDPGRCDFALEMMNDLAARSRYEDLDKDWLLDQLEKMVEYATSTSAGSGQ